MALIDMDEKRLAGARAVFGEIAAGLRADLSVELWNGEVLPLGPGARRDVRLVIRAPEAIRRILMKPRLMTFFELYGEGAVDLVGATPLEAAARWDHMRALRLRRGLDRGKLVRAAWPFLVGGRAKAPPLPGFSGAIGAAYQRGRDDASMIRFHYDVSNEFYALFLDPEMVYSSAYFADDETSLEAAQRRKLDLICAKLQIRPGERLLDIGCGWAGLACHAAREYGAIVHGVTLSQAQLDYGKAKVEREGLAGKVRLELRDYRTLEAAAQYDKIAQIEMFEHIGFSNHDLHFAHMRKLLRPRGLYLHQASVRLATRDLKAFTKRNQYQDVIDRFIFPGGQLDHIGMTVTNLERFGFEVHDVEGMREHFQRTVRRWNERLASRFDEAVRLVGLERARIWLLYFALCALGFERGPIGVFQTLASKRFVGASGLPIDRARRGWF